MLPPAPSTAERTNYNPHGRRLGVQGGGATFELRGGATTFSAWAGRVEVEPPQNWRPVGGADELRAERRAQSAKQRREQSRAEKRKQRAEKINVDTVYTISLYFLYAVR